ncbi:MAG: tRNA pseudouridine(38-40) synthase TruA [Rickettsiales bacterium]|jgi:tRNA pseudouridine38-40 synthase|nr:tRNA pseudouridine(38-40) synthase TruA [Rickettsiales bacterium]
MPRYKLTIEYNGSGFAGWQKQPDRPSIQETIETATQKFSGEKIEVVGAGRTDAGVHATGQVAHIDLAKHYEPYKVMQGINFYLFQNTIPSETEGTFQPLDSSASTHDNINKIAITNAQIVADDFHARFSATRRFYVYRIINRRARLGLDNGRAWQVPESLDIEAMQQAANHLLGHHDFTSFRDSECQAKSPLKTLDSLEVRRYGDEIRILTHARSFLHHQVRIIVGTLVQVGKGRWTADDVKQALEAKDRSAAGPTAPPEGLYLVGVAY